MSCWLLTPCIPASTPLSACCSPQYLRAVLTGIEGTPYASGIFLFDIFLPADYPKAPCLCTHVTPNAHLVHANNGPGGFSPNLHSGEVT